MNKQELIEKLKTIDGGYGSRYYIAMGDVFELVEQLDEPQKPVVPQFVADWYEEHKDNLEYNIWDWMKYNLEPKKRENVIFSRWLGKTVNNPVETLIKMKLYGYEVEKEKRYLVKIKGNVSENILVFGLVTQVYFFSKDKHNSKCRQTTHTRKELERSGFGWVFNCPGVEVKEMKE